MDAERRLILLENSVREMDERLAELYRETAGLSLQKSAALKGVARSAVVSKKHAAEVKKLHAELTSEFGAASEKVEAVRVRANAVLRELYDTVDSLKASNADILKRLDGKAAPVVEGADVESLRAEVRALTERLSSLEGPKASVPSATDVNNLKLAVAELSNKNRLINELALENQRISGRIFTLEEKLSPKEEKTGENAVDA